MCDTLFGQNDRTILLSDSLNRQNAINNLLELVINKNPDGIAHKVLADRMAERNPGDKPKPNDRIPYIYVEIDESPIPNGFYKNKNPKYKKRKILQGYRIEHPDYIKQPIDMLENISD